MLSNSLKSPAGEFPESIVAFRLPLDHQEGSIFHARSVVVKKLEHTQSREETARVHIQKKRESEKHYEYIKELQSAYSKSKKGLDKYSLRTHDLIILTRITKPPSQDPTADNKPKTSYFSPYLSGGRSEEVSC